MADSRARAGKEYGKPGKSSGARTSRDTEEASIKWALLAKVGTA